METSDVVVREILRHRAVLHAYLRAIVRDPHLAEDLFQDVSIILMKKFPDEGSVGDFWALAREVASRRIQVNALAPGFVDTPLLDEMHSAYPLMAAGTPLGRLGQPDDIADVIAFL